MSDDEAPAKRKRPVCTWLTTNDYDRLVKVAKSHRLSIASILRSIVLDVIVEEERNLRAAKETACEVTRITI